MAFGKNWPKHLATLEVVYLHDKVKTDADYETVKQICKTLQLGWVKQ